jgi:hypothetical protein
MKGEIMMVLVYTTNFKDIENVKTYLNIVYRDEYCLLTDSTDLYDKLIFDVYDIIIFDDIGDIELIDMLRELATQMSSLKVISSDVKVGQMYLSLTENIQIKPKPLNIMMYLWDNPAFSLDNIIAAQESNISVFKTQLKPIEYGNSFITIKTTVDETNDIDLISIEFNNLYDFTEMQEVEEEEDLSDQLQEEEVEVVEAEEQQRGKFDKLKSKFNIAKNAVINTAKAGVDMWNSEMDLSDPDNVFVEPNGEDEIEPLEEESVTESPEASQEESTDESSGASQEELIDESSETPIEVKQKRLLEELDSLTEIIEAKPNTEIQEAQAVVEAVQEEQLTEITQEEEPVIEVQNSVQEEFVNEVHDVLQEQQPISEIEESDSSEPVQVEEPSAETQPEVNEEEPTEDLTIQETPEKKPKKKKGFNPFAAMFKKKEKEEPEEEEEAPRKLSTIRRKKLVMYKTDIEYFTATCEKKELIEELYKQYLAETKSGAYIELSEMLLEKHAISEDEYIGFTRNFLHRDILTLEDLRNYELKVDQYSISNFKENRFIELEPKESSARMFIVSNKSYNTINNLKKAHEQCRIMLTLDKYLDIRIAEADK